MMPSRVAEQRLRRGIAERDQDVRVHQLDLALDEGQADLRLLRRRRAVAGRPPRNDVGDIGLAAIEADRGDHAVEQLARAADERQALDVLVAAGRLADEHHARLRIAVGEHELGRGRSQRAAVEFVEQRAQRLQRRRGARGLARGGDRRIGRRRRLGETGEQARQVQALRAGAGSRAAARPLRDRPGG